MSNGLMAYFGYGSLVNLDTLQSNCVAVFPAVLKGWRRHWQARQEPVRASGSANLASERSVISHSGRERLLWRSALEEAGAEHGVTSDDLALLSVHASPETEILGMLIVDRIEYLPALDDRERLYDRVTVPPGALKLLGGAQLPAAIKADKIFIYVGQPSAKKQTYLLQSYLDTVMAGFFKVHGEAGLKNLIDTTLGFEQCIITDRDNPIYPRAVSVGRKDAQQFDKLLADAGVKFS